MCAPNIEDNEQSAARFAADLIPSGAVILGIGEASSAIRPYLPAGCFFVPSDRLNRPIQVSSAGDESVESKRANATHVVALHVLNQNDGWRVLLADLAAFSLPIVLGGAFRQEASRTSSFEGPENATLAEIREEILQLGLSVRSCVRYSDRGVLLYLSRPLQLARKVLRVLVLSYNNCGNFGDRLGIQVLNGILPAEAQVFYAHFWPWDVPDEEFDWVVVGAGNSLFRELVSQHLIALLRRTPVSVGLFGTQYRESLDRIALSQMMAELTVWFARYEEDLLLFGSMCRRAVHVGDCLAAAFPLARWTKDETLHVGSEVWHDAPLDRTIRAIQDYAAVFSERVHPLLCAMTSADRVGYREQREDGTGNVSGKFRSLLIDVLGRARPEGTMFRVDRAAIQQYRAMVLEKVEFMSSIFRGFSAL